jgi:hypothetical protein
MTNTAAEDPPQPPEVDANPFGDPDGARADIQTVMDKFVGFQGQKPWGGIASSPNDRTIRVIVGRKGAGKTVYLRR